MFRSLLLAALLISVFANNPPPPPPTEGTNSTGTPPPPPPGNTSTTTPPPPPEGNTTTTTNTTTTPPPPPDTNTTEPKKCDETAKKKCEDDFVAAETEAKKETDVQKVGTPLCTAHTAKVECIKTAGCADAVFTAECYTTKEVGVSVSDANKIKCPELSCPPKADGAADALGDLAACAKDFNSATCTTELGSATATLALKKPKWDDFCALYTNAASCLMKCPAVGKPVCDGFASALKAQKAVFTDAGECNIKCEESADKESKAAGCDGTAQLACVAAQAGVFTGTLPTEKEELEKAMCDAAAEYTNCIKKAKCNDEAFQKQCEQTVAEGIANPATGEKFKCPAVSCGSSPPLPLIIGITGGVLAALVILGIIVMVMMSKKKKKGLENDAPVSEYDDYEYNDADGYDED